MYTEIPPQSGIVYGDTTSGSYSRSKNGETVVCVCMCVRAYKQLW